MVDVRGRAAAVGGGGEVVAGDVADAEQRFGRALLEQFVEDRVHALRFAGVADHVVEEAVQPEAFERGREARRGRVRRQRHFDAARQAPHELLEALGGPDVELAGGHALAGLGVRLGADEVVDAVLAREAAHGVVGVVGVECGGGGGFAGDERGVRGQEGALVGGVEVGGDEAGVMGGVLGAEPHGAVVVEEQDGVVHVLRRYAKGRPAHRARRPGSRLIRSC